jgi:DNA-binding MarR family transcriptional regulator
MKDLQTSIKQKKAFACPEEELFLNLMRTHSVLAGKQEAMFKEKSLTMVQYNVLRILRGAEEGELRTHDICDRMVTRVPDITRLIDRLIKASFVTRRRCSEDRRAVYVKITTKALKLLKELDGPAKDSAISLFGSMTKKDIKTLNNLLVEARKGE